MPQRPSHMRQTARELVADFLRTEIITGALPPRAKLNIAEISERLGVSPTPAREAVQLLAAERLVQLDAYRSARVAELSADEYEEICAVRLGLEGLAARLGAEAIDDAGVGQMRDAYERMQSAAAAKDVDAFITADRTFHEIHYTACGRASLWRRIIDLRRAAERYTRAVYALPRVGNMQDTLRTHKDLLEAVAAREPARAQEIIEDDLRATAEALVGQLRSAPGVSNGQVSGGSGWSEVFRA
jgi:GntR family transcriptional regulator, rspAB operon transcriptional repressor